MKKTLLVILWIVFLLYVAVMLWLLFGQRMGDSHTGTYAENLKHTLMPFGTILHFGKVILTGEPSYLVPHAWKNLLGNVFMFMPIGTCLPCFFTACRRYRTIFWVGLVIVAGIEFTQFFTLLGSLDFDDFMLNLIGISAGFAVWRLLHEKLGSISSRTKH